MKGPGSANHSKVAFLDTSNLQFYLKFSVGIWCDRDSFHMAGKHWGRNQHNVSCVSVCNTYTPSFERLPIVGNQATLLKTIGKKKSQATEPGNSLPQCVGHRTMLDMDP